MRSKVGHLAVLLLTLGLILVPATGYALAKASNESSVTLTTGETAYFTINVYDTSVCNISVDVVSETTVDIFLFDEENFKAFKNLETAYYFGEGTKYYAKNMTAEVELGPGRYYLIIDNSAYRNLNESEFVEADATISAVITLTDGTIEGPTVTSDFYGLPDWIYVAVMLSIITIIVVVTVIVLVIMRLRKKKLRELAAMMQSSAPPVQQPAPQPQPRNKFCNQCGTPLPPEANFCKECGWRQ